jgi:hypothetical protein
MPANQMKEERVVDPYESARRAASAAKPTQFGQNTINSEAKSSGAADSAVTSEETVTLSPQMAALARKEQRFRQREQAVKDREVALEARNAKLAQLEAMQTKLAAKDYSGIEDLVKYDEYTNYLIEKDSNLSPEQLELKKQREEIEAIKAAALNNTTKAFEAAVEQRRQAVGQLIESKPEYAIIKKANASEAVVKHILDTWEEESKEITPEQAAQDVKKVLLEKRAEWLALGEEEIAPPEDDATQKKQLPPLRPQIKTLTNQMAATGEIKRQPKSLSGMSDAERYAEARRRAEEKLKQGIR